MNPHDTITPKAPIPLDLPIISAALDGGLMPIEYLQSPITVNFPVWPAAEPGYTYQLVLDGERVPPEKAILESDKAGDVLSVEIPVELLTDGDHAVSYRIFSPNTQYEVFSDSTPLRIDRAAPGTPDLAPIIFPAEINDGLTSDELEAMNNVLPGRIASYNGMTVGDVVRTYWGELEGPLVTVDANDMGLNTVTVNFPRELLEQADGASSQVYTP